MEKGERREGSVVPKSFLFFTIFSLHASLPLASAQALFKLVYLANVNELVNVCILAMPYRYSLKMSPGDFNLCGISSSRKSRYTSFSAEMVLVMFLARKVCV